MTLGIRVDLGWFGVIDDHVDVWRVFLLCHGTHCGIVEWLALVRTDTAGLSYPRST